MLGNLIYIGAAIYVLFKIIYKVNDAIEDHEQAKTMRKYLDEKYGEGGWDLR